MYINPHDDGNRKFHHLSHASVEDRKRRALKRAIEQSGMNLAEIARLAGFERANFLYNYFNGRSSSLSVSTIEKLDKVVPGISAAVLHLASDSKLKDVGIESVTVRMATQCGKLLTANTLPIEEQFEAPMPIGKAKRALGAFGVLVRHPGFDLVYPEGSILVAMPVNVNEHHVHAGDQLILERYFEDKAGNLKVEVTLRKLAVEDGNGYLLAETRSLAYQAPIPVPWPTDGKARWMPEGTRSRLDWIIVGAYIKVR